MRNIEKITKDLLIEIGEDPNREGLLRTPLRVSKSWEYLTEGYKKSYWYKFGFPKFADSIDDIRKNLI